MTILVTGVAGFIGSHVAQVLLDRGDRVIGLDSLNDYYSVQLKRDRLARLEGRNGFRFHQVDLADFEALKAVIAEAGPIRGIVHLAAQAGVRYSLTNPHAYLHSNLTGHLNMLEIARHADGLDNMVYASSSSVYGGNTKLPFSVEDRVDNPVSLYAATKKSDELMSHAYAHLFRIPLTGLRFFTVYGPWGRPDMALWLFTEAILAGKPISVFNNGDMSRDFTYVDDIVKGIVGSLDHPAADDGTQPPYKIYNIGNHQAEPLMRMIEVLEDALGMKAEKQMEPMQAGDVQSTYADIEAIRRDIGFEPSTPIDVGIPKFVDWYRTYHRV
ncbi:NAD-dependent epimerase/dehydratase family protein [Minwuia sp.]|uniref:NAD-dependent epimerase/dehydratase family protein n=1 Tax=Minwuia sp. TaxID=2493630 RepID=UPI003A92F105